MKFRNPRPSTWVLVQLLVPNVDPPPFKGLNMRILIIIPIKGRGLLIRGLG